MELTIDSSSSNKNSSAIDITGICSRGVLSFKIGSYLNGTSSSIPTLFVLPPGEGGAESYFGNIAQNLGGFNLIIFNNFYLAMNKPDTCSFEQLAKMYLKYIRELQPHGPYHFWGGVSVDSYP
ncbi:N-(5-amino-5-carboxypentanoyl)-L-cysteinyl-D-valine synthase [Folsomia candida]|uniref:oleoyl-[acyl-carrier-protein] hydrolase n=1 Tax=Folsomia candida TaxID=158441 RepID=A0A226D1D6_FOLCA|nr:N-(5-amino-5-carboxypentanoyl)-L-cysteinyl-D-valine synthase [Folsomia candida]